MDEASQNDPRVVMTVNDLEQIRSHAIKNFTDLSPQRLNMDEHQFRTYCYIQGVQAWLRTKGLLKVILD